MRFTKTIVLFLAFAAAPAFTHPLKVHNGRVFIPVTINGVAAEALLDSAAEMTFVDPSLARRLHLAAEGSETAKGSGGPTQVQFAKGVTVDAVGVHLADLTVALLDMRDLSKRLVETDLEIILGREFFDAARVRIDLHGATIEPVARDLEPRGVKLALTSARGIESVPCTVESKATQADIDIGNGSDVLIGREFAAANGLLAAGRVVGKKTGGGIGGSVDRDIVVLRDLEIAGVHFQDVRGAIDPQPTAGPVNVGTSILERFVLTIDYAGHVAWFDAR